MLCKYIVNVIFKGKFEFPKNVCLDTVRMWSLTSIDRVAQAEQVGLESASVSTRGKRRTSSAMWKTKLYVSSWFLVDL